MAFNIKNDHTDELLRELTELTGESLTTSVTESLRERLERERRRRATSQSGDDPIAGAIAHFRSVAAAGPTDASNDPLDYDEHGLPT